MRILITESTLSVFLALVLETLELYGTQRLSIKVYDFPN